MQEMAQALETDFEGREDLRQYLINKVPHYGNDIPEVDELAKFATDSFFDKLEAVSYTHLDVYKRQRLS